MKQYLEIDSQDLDRLRKMVDRYTFAIDHLEELDECIDYTVEDSYNIVELLSKILKNNK